MIKPKPFIETYTGKKFYFTDPEPDMIDIRDIAHSLSLQCWFMGHVETFYSVAEHSVAVSCIVDTENALAALLHDAAEAYLSDIPRPIKKLLPLYQELEDSILNAIFYKFGLGQDIDYNSSYYQDIKDADNTQLKTEAKYLLSSQGKDWIGDYPTKGRKGKVPNCLAPIHAEALFLRSFEEITGTKIEVPQPSLIMVN